MDETRLKASEISRMMFGYPASQTLDPDAYRVLLDEFCRVVDAVPARIVEAVCRDVKQGRLGNPAFRPNVAELAAWCRKRIDDEGYAMARLTMRKTVEPCDPPGHRERMREKFRALLDELKRGKAASDA